MRYHGILNEPIRVDYGLITPSKAREVERAQHQRVAALFKLYGLEQGDWRALAMKLASDHVPGLRLAYGPKGRRGRPKVWDSEALRDLWAAVEQYKLRNPRQGVQRACERLHRSDPQFKRWGAKVLKRKYYDACELPLIKAYMAI